MKIVEEVKDGVAKIEMGKCERAEVRASELLKMLDRELKRPCALAPFRLSVLHLAALWLGRHCQFVRSSPYRISLRAGTVDLPLFVCLCQSGWQPVDVDVYGGVLVGSKLARFTFLIKFHLICAFLCVCHHLLLLLFS